MIDTPQITQSTALITAVVRHTIPRDQIQAVMGPSITEVMAAVTAQGIRPAGPFFSYHYRMDPKIFDFEVGIPVSQPIAPVGNVRRSELRATMVARTIYHGPYEGLGPAWGELEAWLVANGHKMAPDLWEFYSTGPESSPNSADWRTEINRPLLGD